MIAKFGSPSDARAEDGQRTPKGRDVVMGDEDHKPMGETAGAPGDDRSAKVAKLTEKLKAMGETEMLEILR
eukprot:5511345-Alexandrium_andersonii.AAC.1